MAALSLAPLPFPQVVTLVHGAVNAHDGPLLARLFASPLSASTPVERQLPRAILSALTHSSERFLNPLAFRLPEPWREVLVAHVQVLVLIQQAAFTDAATDADRGSAAELDSWEQAYKTQHALVSAYLTKHLAASTAWSLPVLYVLLRTLRQLATKADALAILSPSPSSSSAPPPSSLSSGNSSNSSGGGGGGGSGGWVRSEAVARLTMKAFTICATDRSCSIPGSAEARQWGIYALGNQLIKAYFALGRPSLATNLIRAVDNAPSKPPLTAYPKADQVTWRFLMGTLHLLGGQWPKARAELEVAWQLCHHAAVVQQRQLLTVLLPLELVVHGRLPSRTLLAAHPPLQHLYGPFVEAVRKADVGAYDRALERAVGWAVEKRVWAVLERAREVVVRGALRKTWVALGRPNRVSVEAWKCGLRLLGAAGGGGPGAVGGTGPEAAAAAGIESQRRRREEGEAAAAAAATAAEVGEEETTTTTTPAAEGWADLGLETAEDVECLLAGMIYKGYVKGYISHGHQVVVLSKQGAFPPLASRVAAGPE